ncbi:MAG: gliding motility protein GldM [Cyclobacteriaceae bacterium]|nr:gliding motility protein GldM [Cyclobacteriaceae bacterium]
MSGGRQSPRDKMIGMMYLVLTALLALQVSNAVLEKFIFIDQALTRMADEYGKKNTQTITGIQAQVAKRNNLEADVAILNIAKEIRTETAGIITKMSDIKKEMAIITGAGDPDGYDDETGALIGAKDYDKVGTMMVGPEGKGKQLQKDLNAYSKFLTEKTGEPEDRFPKLAKGAEGYPEFANDPNQKGKNFSQLFFENTPTAAGMATMSYLETEILNYERVALAILADSVGAGEVSFDKIFPLIRAESNVVAAGAKYKAEMFIAASSSALNPVMYKDGKALPLSQMSIAGNDIKFGQVEFSASGSGEKSYKAKIELDGKVYEDVINYTVIKPSILISSSALSALWKNCGNALNVQVPLLGTSYNPSISATNATVVPGGGKGEVTIIPKTRGKVVMTVRSNGATVGTKTFSVKEIPLPKYELVIPSSAGNMADGVKGRAFRQVTVNAKAEPSFASDVPKDARYRVREVEVKLVRNGDPVKVQTFKKNKITLTQFAQQARKGDIYIFTIKRVVRTNFQNKSENVRARNEIYKVLVKSN